MSFIIDFEKYYRKKKGLMSAEEEARYDSEQASKQLHEKWKQEEENGSASSAMETSKRFENWMQNSKSLSSAYAKDATSRNYMNKTSSESSQFMLKNLADQAAKLQLDLEKNRSYLGDDYVSKAMEYIRAATGQNKAVSDALTQKQDILSRFKDQTEYERAVKDSDYRNMTSEERLAEADRLESSNKSEADRIRILDEQWSEEDFLSGKSYDQIKAEEKEIEQQILERRNRISEMMYSVSYYDTDEKKQQIQEERQQIMKEVDDLQKKHDILKQNEYYVKMDEAVSKVPEDMKYWLEKEAEYRQSAEAMNSPFDFIPAGTKLMDNKDEYAEAIRKVEQYAKENGQDIDLLKDYYTRKVNAEEAQVHAENMEALSDNVFGAIGGSIYSVPANILGGVSSVGGTIGNFVSNLFAEDYVPVDRYSKMYRHSDTADLIRGNVAENLGDVGGFLYQSGMSMADSLAVLPLNAVAPGAGAALLGTAAASSSIRDTLDRGGTTGEALANGIFAGVAETIFEKVSLDSLFKLKNVNSIKDAVTNIAKQSFTEGSEEFFTEISNRITDEIVMADKSAYNERVKELVLSGMSEEEAKKQADTEFVQQLASSFAGGALSGGVFGAGKSVIDYRSSDAYKQNIEAKKVERANKLAEKKAKQEQQQSETQQATSETGDPIMDAAKQLAYRQEAESQESRESSPVRVTKVGENASIQTANGKTVSPENVNFLNDNQRQLYERATTFQTEAEANAFINNYDGKTNVDSYYSGYSAFSKAAQLYDSFDDAMKVNAYRQAANRIGESVAKSAFISSFNTQNNITVSQQERAEIQKTGGVIRNYSVKPSRSVSAQIDALEIIGKKYGLAIEAVNTIGGKANGFYDPNTKRIVVALDADDGGIVRVASHELYHHIENVNPADAAQIRSVVISALKAKSDYDYEAQKKWLMSKGYSEADVDSEIVAQSMFDVLNADTIEKLRNENPSLLQKIKNWIDSFFKVLEDAIDRLSTKKYGGAEIRALRNDRETLSKVREMVLDALEKEIQKKSEQTDTNNQSNDVKFSVKDLSEQIEEIQDGTFPRGNHVYVGKTPKILSDVGFNSDLPMLTTVHHIRKAMLPKNEKLHHHGITKKQLSLLPQKIADPVMIMDSLDPKSNAVVVVTDMLDPDGMPIIAIIKADGSGMYNNVEILTNFVSSYYGRKNFANFVQRNVNADTFLYINKEKSRKLSNQAKVQFFGKLNSYDFDTIIRKTNAKVNSKNEKAQIKFSVKDDSDVDTKALMRENEHLKKMLELARRELKLTKGHQVKPGTFEKLANKYKRQYGSRMETSEIASDLQKMYDYIANGEEPNAEVAFDMAADIARDIVNQSKMTSPALLEETKAVRDHLRNTAVYFPENVRSDINYSEVKSSLFGRLKIRNDGLPVDTYLAEMKEIFPEYADLPAESSAQAAESLLSIVDGVYTEYVAATNEDIDSAAAILASDIFNDYFDVPEYKTFADKKYEQMQEQKMEYQKTIRSLKINQNSLLNEIKKLKKEKIFNDNVDTTIKELNETSKSLISQYNSNMTVEEMASRLDQVSRMNKRINKMMEKGEFEKAEKTADLMSQRIYSIATDMITDEKGNLKNEFSVDIIAYDIAENLLNVPLTRGYRTRLYAQRRDAIRKAKESERKQLVENRRRTLIRSIARTSKNLIKRYTEPTNKQNIPLEFEAAVGDIFSNLDLSNIKPSSIKQSDWGDMVYYLQKVIDFKNKRKESVDYDSLSIYLDPYLRQNVLEASAQIYELAQQNGGKIDPSQIPNETLEIIDNSLLSILHSTVEYGKLKANQKQARVSELGKETIRTNESKYKKRPATINGIKQLVTLESADAHTFLLGMGESGESLYQALQSGDAKAKLLMREASEEIESIINEEVEKDKKFKKKFYDDTVFAETFDGTEVSLNKQQVIDLYMLSKRTDALRHLIYGKYTEEQLNVTDFDKEQKTKSSDETKESKDKDIDYYVFEGQGFIVGDMRNPVRVTIDELKEVFKKHISPADKRVADKIQKYMSTRVAEWGNEVSLALYGIEKYTSENYMHMEIYQNTLDTKDSNMSKSQSITRILNPGFSKNVNRNATNPLVIRDAMNEVTGHISQMAYHSGLALPTADLYAWFNYRSKNGSVKRAMTDRYGDSPKFSKNKNNAEPASPIKYFENLLLDISGQMVGDPSQFGFLGKALTSYGKSQAVGANLRVAIQQFAAVFRSMGMVDPKYFAVPAKNPIAEFNQAAKYSGAVAGKDMGVYNRYSQSQFSEVVTGRKNIRKRLSDLGMWPSEFVDKIQWGLLWHAVKAETLKKHSNLVKNSEQHLKLAGQRMDEVCYETQVVGSVLTKTNLGRSKSDIVKSMTAFTSEQTTAINYMIRSFYRNGKKGLAKASVFNTVSTVIAGALASVVSAFRDDDDYKTWLEKYLSAFTGDVVKNAIPFGYMPFVSDTVDFITGNGDFENKIMAFEAIEQYKTLFNYIGKMLSGEEVDMLKFANSLTKTFSVSTGIPLSNAEREIRTLWNTVVSTMGRNDLKWRTSDFYVTKDSALYEQLYQAQMNNDQKTIQRVMEELESRDKTDSQIKTGLKNVAKDLFSGEIEEAAKAKNDGDTSTYEKMLGEIQEQTPIERKDVRSLIDNAAKKLLSDEEDAETEQEESKEEQEETEIVAETDYSTTDIVKYVIDGGYSSSAKKAIDSYYSGYYEKYIKEGKTEKEAASKARGNIKSAITRYYKPMFVDGSPAEREKIKNVLNEIRVDGKKIYSNTDYGEWKKGTN